MSIEYPSEDRAEQEPIISSPPTFKPAQTEIRQRRRGEKMYKFLLVFVFFTLLNVFMEKYLYLSVNDDKNENSHKRAWAEMC